MRFISTRVHGFLDYSVGALLGAAPWLLGFDRRKAEGRVPIALGAGAMAYSLFTDYELGVVRALPMPVHLGMDTMSGILLAGSPWLFGFHKRVRAPHLILGLTEIAVAALTRTEPEKR